MGTSSFIGVIGGTVSGVLILSGILLVQGGDINWGAGSLVAGTALLGLTMAYPWIVLGRRKK